MLRKADLGLELDLEGRRYKKGAGREGLAVEGVFAALVVVAG